MRLLFFIYTPSRSVWLCFFFFPPTIQTSRFCFVLFLTPSQPVRFSFCLFTPGQPVRLGLLRPVNQYGLVFYAQSTSMTWFLHPVNQYGLVFTPSQPVRLGCFTPSQVDCTAISGLVEVMLYVHRNHKAY